MTDYISLSSISNSLHLKSHEIQTDGGHQYAINEVLTGQTSLETMKVITVISISKYFVIAVSGDLTLGEELQDTGAGSSILLSSDALVLSGAITRAQKMLQDLTNRGDLLNTSGTTKIDKIRTKARRGSYNLSRFPILSITSIVLAGTTYTGVEGTGYELEKDAGIINFKDGSMNTKSRYENLVITFLWGYTGATQAALSGVINDLMVIFVRRIWDRFVIESAAHGAQSISPGDFAMTFRFEDLMTEDVKAMLSQQSRILIG